MGKFNDLEVRQDKLMQEMDEAITVYLMEMKEENDRLIEQLKEIPIDKSMNQKGVQPVLSSNMHLIKEESKLEPQTIVLQQELDQEHIIEKKMLVPKNMATSAYNRQKIQAQPQQEVVMQTLDEVPQSRLSFEQQIVALYKEGSTIEEIAKKTQRGKTEIELLLKFHT